MIERISLVVLAVAVAGGLWWLKGDVRALRAEISVIGQNRAERDSAERAEQKAREAVRDHRALADLVHKMDDRLGSVERQMSLALTVIQGRTPHRAQIDERTTELADRIASLREDMDLLLGLEWERFDQGVDPGEPAAVDIAASDIEAEIDDGVDDLDEASSDPDEDEPTSIADTESAEPSVLASLVEEQEFAWRRDFAEMATLNERQREKLDSVLDGIYTQRGQVIEDVLANKTSLSDARDTLRREHRRAYSELRDLLSPRQRKTLRTELQRRNDLYWSLWLSSR